MSDAVDSYLRISREVRESFEDFAARRLVQDPDFLTRLARNGRWGARLSRLLALLPEGFGPFGPRRFLFLSARHASLVECFRSDECALIGNQRDRAFARRMGLQFRFTGRLLAAANAIISGTKGIAGARIVSDWLRLLRRQCQPCFLVMASDTLPISLLLAKISSRCENLVVVCVQHGLFNAGFEPGDIDGRNSDISLVYCDAQRREMERRLPGALVEVMGFPADFVPLDDPEALPRLAILVGIGTFEAGAPYARSLEIFARVRAVLSAQGLGVRYRPHPIERRHAARHVEWPMSLESATTLLAGERKLFVGFSSTLLYEARLAGHVVFVLHDDELPGYSISQIGVPLPVAAIDSLPALLARHAADPICGQAPLPDLRTRFEAAIARGVARLER